MGKSASKKVKHGRTTMKHKKMRGGFSFFGKKKIEIAKISQEEEAKIREELNGITNSRGLIRMIYPFVTRMSGPLSRKAIETFNYGLLEDIKQKLLSNFEVDDTTPNIDSKKTYYVSLIEEEQKLRNPEERNQPTAINATGGKKISGKRFKQFSEFNPLSRYNDANGVIVKITKPIGKKTQKVKKVRRN